MSILEASGDPETTPSRPPDNEANDLLDPSASSLAADAKLNSPCLNVFLDASGDTKTLPSRPPGNEASDLLDPSASSLAADAKLNSPCLNVYSRSQRRPRDSSEQASRQRSQ